MYNNCLQILRYRGRQLYRIVTIIIIFLFIGKTILFIVPVVYFARVQAPHFTSAT